MKTVKILALVFFLVSLNSLAGNGKGTEAKDYSELIKTSLSLPKELNKAGVQEKIQFYFSVDEKGNVTEVDAITDNKEIKQSLEKQFYNLTFPGLKPKATNSVAVNFVVY